MGSAKFSLLWPIGVGCCAAAVVACGGAAGRGPATGGSFVKQCLDRFNNQENSLGQDFVKNAGQKEGYGEVVGGEYEPKVWFGPSKRRPEKCVAVVTLGRDDVLVVFRESFHEGALEGEWASLAGDTEGTFDEHAKRLEEAQAVGLPDGRVKLR